MKFFNLRRVMRAALLLLLMSAGVTKVFAQDFWVDYIQYRVTSETNVEVIGSLVDSNVLTIPSTITYQNQVYTVVGIGSYAFENRANYQHYVLPNTLTTIGTGAFKNSIIESISFSDNLTDIGACAFEGCESLTMLNLTNCTNMTTIGTNAFYGMPNVWLIMLPESITTIGTGAFSGCTNLKNLYLPGSLTTIGDFAFSNCSLLQSLTLPQSVTALGLYLFNGCTALKDLYVQRTTPPSASYQTFDGWFQDYAEHVYVPYGSGSTYQNVDGWLNLYSSNLITETNILLYDYVWDDNHNAVATVTGHVGNVVGALEIPNYSLYYSQYYEVTAVATEAFENCTGITSVTFDVFMKNLGPNAFGGCTGITSVDMSACTNLTAIGGTVFEGCTSMTSVTLPQTLLSIGGYTFYNTGLTSITLPTNVTHIGTGAFCSCRGLTTITSMTTVPPTVGNQAFMGCDNITKIKVPYGSKTDYLAASGWQNFNESVYEEMEPAFDFYYDDDHHIAIVMGYEGIIPSVLEIPATVTHNDVEYTVTAINASAFKNQTGVSQFILPNTITSIGKDAFRGCRYANINIPESLTTLGEGAFVDCDHITSVTLPEGLTSIPALAFYSCSSLTELHLPSTLTSIGIRAFANCNDLAAIYTYATTPPTCAHGNGDDSFLGLDGTTNLYVPFGCYSVYAANAEWNRFSINQGGFTYTLDEVNHTATITGVTEYTFGDLVVPATMNSYPTTTIAANAFSKEGITSISIPASATSINARAFANCVDLTAITVADENTSFSSIDGVLFNKAGTTLVAYPCGKTNASYDIPYDVTSICEYAFLGNQNLTSINLPAALNLGSHYACFIFAGFKQLEAITVDGGSTRYKAIDGVLFSYDEANLLYYPIAKSGAYTVPANVNTIQWAAFQHCKALSGITINSNVTSIEGMAFYDCTALPSVTLPNTITTINSSTFAHCSGLRSVNFLGNVTVIESSAFSQTGLVAITLPATVTNIDGAFVNCNDLGEITCQAENVPTTTSNAFFGVPEDIPVYVPAGSVSAYQNATGWSQFTNIQAITDPNIYITYDYDENNITATVTGLTDNTLSGALVIPGTVQYDNKTYTVTAIADEAFKNCTELTSITTPHTLETIGASAFESCTSMESVVIGRNVKTIGSYAFKYCYNLVNIDYYAVNCGSLNTTIWYEALELNKNLTIRNSVKSIPSYAFFHLVGLTSVTIPSSTESIGEYAFAANNHLTSVTIGSNVKTIGAYAFWRSEITSIDLQNVEEVGKGLFEESTALQTVTLRNSLSRLEDRMFYGCTSLNNVHIPSGVRTIGKQAFMGCSSLTNLVFDNPIQGLLTTIGERAFEGCALTSVDVPSTVTTINDYAFKDCTALKNITLGTGLTTMGNYVFQFCQALETINYYPTNCILVNSSTWSLAGSTSTTVLKVKEGVQTLPLNAFSNLQLKQVNLPGTLQTIGVRAFYSTGLTSVTIPNSVTTIGDDTFYLCNLNTITLGSSLANIGEYAFAGSNSINTITTYNITPPAVTANAFSNYNATLKVLAPAMDAYTGHEVWSRFTIESLDGYYFTGATDNNWGTASNWLNGTVPTTELNEVTAVIMADATVNIINAFVNFFTIMDGTTVTVASGKSLKIGDDGYGSFISSDASALVVEDGGSLVNNLNENIAATIEKSITGHNGNAGKWYFISSPIVGANTYEENYNLYYYTAPNSVENLFANPANNYDLYAFDQSAAEAEWVNYKQHPEDFKLVDGNGYLYANRDNTILSFVGDVRPSNSEYPMTPVRKQDTQIVYNNPDNPDEGYYEQTIDYPFTGWNLVGNPFTCKAYIKDDYSILSGGFYKMNADGTGITSVEGFSEEIPSGTGVFVKVSDMFDPMGGNQYAFTTETPRGGAKKGSLHIVLKQTLMRGEAVQVDNAIVSFNEGSRLEKMVLFRDDAHIAIPQNGKEYAIVCTEPCGEMPLNLNAVMGGRFTLEVAPKDVEMSYLHLIDNLTGTDVDLLKESSYSFESNISDYASRFKLVFVAGSVADEMENFAFFSNGNLVIANDGQATLQVIDINGRVLRSERISGSANVSLNESAGVYMLRLVNGENVKTQKIIIK